MSKKIARLFLLLIVASVTATATEIKPPKKVVNGATRFVVAKNWQILYYKVNNKPVFNTLNCVRGQSGKKRFALVSGKVLSQKCTLEDGLFSMQRKVILKGAKIEADLKIDIVKNGKIDFCLKLNYKEDVIWTTNHRRMSNMLVMKTSSPVNFKAITAKGKELNGTTKAKVNYSYLRELNIKTDAGNFVIKAENEATSIRLTSPKQMGAKFTGAYIMVGLFSLADKGKAVSFEEGDSEELRFSVSPLKQEKSDKEAN